MKVHTLTAEIAVGELIDKITILKIKSERIADADKLANINAELDTLNKVRGKNVPDSEKISQLEGQLKAVNEDLWLLEDNIRYCEKHQDFGEDFVTYARNIYRTNDKRAALKREINILVGSSIIEEKSYEEF